MSQPRNYTFSNLIRYFLKLGATGFGGPIVLVASMQRDLVEKDNWISKEEFDEGVTLSQLSPGPFAAQMAIYIGWLKGRWLGAALVGLAFVFPSFLMVVGISIAYIQFGGLPWMQSVFYGIGAAVIAIIAMSAHKLVKRTFKSDRLLWALGLISAVFTAWSQTESLTLFIIAGLVVLFFRSRKSDPKASFGFFIPSLFLSGINGVAQEKTLLDLFYFFSKAGAFVFGSGLAIVPFLHGGVVLEHAWLTERQFLDAVAVAMITPGPVVITVAFIGYLVAGFAGAGTAAIAVFLPCYLFTVIPAPYFSKYSKNKKMRAFIDGVTASAIGAIAGAAFVLARNSLIDIPSISIAVLILLVLIKFKKIPEPIMILIAGLVGFAIKGF